MEEHTPHEKEETKQCWFCRSWVINNDLIRSLEARITYLEEQRAKQARQIMSHDHGVSKAAAMIAAFTLGEPEDQRDQRFRELLLKLENDLNGIYEHDD